jgi:phage shock protein E
MFRWLACSAVFLLSIAVATGLPADEAYWIDVRTAGEFNTEHVSGAVNIPYTEIAARIGEVTADKDATIYVYCRSGRRSGIARETLIAQGFTNVTNLGGLQEAQAKAGEAADQ